MKVKLLKHIPWSLAFFGLVSCSAPSIATQEDNFVGKQVAAKSQSLEEEEPLKVLSGIASWYSIRTNGGRETASGRVLDDQAATAAHKTLPFGSKVRVTCLFNGKSEVVRINDRGPYKKGRVIDVTKGTAKRLGFHARGITKVKVEVLSLGDWKYRRNKRR